MIDCSTNNSKNDKSKKQIIIDDAYIINSRTHNIFFEAMYIKGVKIKSIILIAYFAIMISIEVFYRDYLFEKSIEVEEWIEEGKDVDSFFFTFWKLVSELGTAKATLTFFAIIFLLFPLNNSILFMQAVSYSSFATNFLKMIYRNHRPYWHSEKLLVACNSGYGNPSGHSCTSSCVYLSLAHIITNINFFKETNFGVILRIIIFIVLSVIAILIMLSRIILGAHSINQVLYGMSLGIGIYFLIIHILAYHIFNGDVFLRHFRNKTVILVYMILHISLVIISTIIYVSVPENKDIDLIKATIFNGTRCKAKKDYSMFMNDGYYQSLSMLGVVGMHLGFHLYAYFLEKKSYLLNSEVIAWNSSSVANWFKRLPLVLVCCVGIIFYFVIPGSWNIWAIFMLKSAIAFFLAAFGALFPGAYLCVILGWANEKIRINDKQFEELDKV